MTGRVPQGQLLRSGHVLFLDVGIFMVAFTV